MVVIPTSSGVYSNARKYFCKEYWKPGDTDLGLVIWLREQGCFIDREPRDPKSIYAVDRLDVCPGIDRLIFPVDQDATVFILKWS